VTDKKLLELAAKAAGYNGKYRSDLGYFEFMKDDKVLVVNWNPLEDDGEAFRLAVKLQMDVSIEDCGAWVNDRITVMDIDRYAATRRAIVLAAARIGEFGDSL
jgi:hypothetical protein